MAQTDLTPTVWRLLEARERANNHDFEKALAELRELTGYVEKPGVLRCAWCKRVLKPRHVADERGSDGICPDCLREAFGIGADGDAGAE
jgi:hypothetical protein